MSRPRRLVDALTASQAWVHYLGMLGLASVLSRVGALVATGAAGLRFLDHDLRLFVVGGSTCALATAFTDVGLMLGLPRRARTGGVSIALALRSLQVQLLVGLIGALAEFWIALDWLEADVPAALLLALFVEVGHLANWARALGRTVGTGRNDLVASIVLLVAGLGFGLMVASGSISSGAGAIAWWNALFVLAAASSFVLWFRTIDRGQPDVTRHSLRSLVREFRGLAVFSSATTVGGFVTLFIVDSASRTSDTAAILFAWSLCQAGQGFGSAAVGSTLSSSTGSANAATRSRAVLLFTVGTIAALATSAMALLYGSSGGLHSSRIVWVILMQSAIPLALGSAVFGGALLANGREAHLAIGTLAASVVSVAVWLGGLGVSEVARAGLACAIYQLVLLIFSSVVWRRTLHGDSPSKAARLTRGSRIS